MSGNSALSAWVEDCERLCRPDEVVWCDGSPDERERLTQKAILSGDLISLDQERLPGCTLHRSNPNDVARTEGVTYICCPRREDAGPTNNWMDPSEAYRRVGTILDSCMRGRTMYVVPFLMGPPGSPFSRIGVELTDSVYVALSMGLMTRMGRVALEQLGSSERFTRGLHSKADLNPERRYICHFPQDDTIWSVGSGYGGNALLSKKCLALRLASVLGREQGWLAEHMLIVGVEDPSGRVRYLAGAFPSACGKTNLAMLVPPERLKGWRVWTVGDDIAWLRPGADGRLYAVNPEAGFFGVAPGTSMKSNPNAATAIQSGTIFTNVALKPDGTVWWEGLEDPPPQCIDWKGQAWTPGTPTPAAHPNSRFTVDIHRCPSFSPEWDNPQGVPLSAILFGSRRASVVPLVYQSFDWRHGTFLGATLSSETTAAATGQVGVVRRDPFAMLPFCGYNMADYFGHWLEIGRRLSSPPKIFRVNWFRRGSDGRFLWPGFGENLRVLQWVLDRAEGNGEARDTPIGWLPTESGLDLEGLNISPRDTQELLAVDPAQWLGALESQQQFLEKFGARMPAEMWEEHHALARRLAAPPPA
ncbi:MAG TPA: phosphoenolpyruvate carboxykinase (GTP) [Candidatus Polarisedimenticolia bacterium]|nr:phosphoenolpyruvate carboxykinase (GTP) [Candidatus Polarisedimenticolia bacterium]